MIWFSLFKLFPGLDSFIRWCDATSVGTYVRQAAWAFKFIETVHILAWVVLLGSTMIVNLRLLGILRGWSIEQVAGNVSMFVHVSLVLVATTGVLMFLSNPERYFTNIAFGTKMLCFLIAVIYQLTLYRSVVRIHTRKIPMWARLSGVFSLVVWFAVGAAGRAIGAL